MSAPTRSRVKFFGWSAAVVGLAVGGASLSAAFAPPAQALPVSQQSCAFDVQSNTAANGWQPVANSVVLAGGGRVVVNLNADAGVDAGAEIRIGYSVDGGAVQTPGAQNFANHTEYWQTRHSMVVLSVPSGTHAIQPYWRISGSTGKNGVIGSRCLTAESATS